MKRSRQRRPLQLETLEARRVMAGSINFLGDLNTQPNLGSSQPGADPSFGADPGVSDFADVAGVAYFSAKTSLSGDSVWRSNGTEEGTLLLREGIAPHGFKNVGGTVFFSALDSQQQESLWKTDGTPAGTMLVASIAARTTSFTDVNGTLYFAGTDGKGISGLFKSDGTAASTSLVFSSTAALPRSLVNLGGTLYFNAARSTTDPLRSLWKSDGTPAGTVRVDDLASDFDPTFLVEFGGQLYFSARGLEGRELWKSDGTTAGTTLVTDVDPGNPTPQNPGNPSSSPRRLTAVGDQLFFTADQQGAGEDLWVTDGTAAGTHKLRDADFSEEPILLRNVSNTLYFVARKTSETVQQLWVSDGTELGTQQVSAFNGDTSSNAVNSLVAVGDTLYFQAYDALRGKELWKSNGTLASTVVVKDLAAGVNSSSPTRLANIGGTLFFAANGGTQGQELYKSDGTATGTVLVKDIEQGNLGSQPDDFVSVGATTFFTANFKPSVGDAFPQGQLWRTAGTAASTVKVANIFSYQGPANDGPTVLSGNYLTNVNGTLYFANSDATHGFELWRTDGTPAGTKLVKDIFFGASSSIPRYLTNVNGTLYFSAQDSANNAELWKSDGTEAGTVLVKDLNLGAASYPRDLTNRNGTLHFAAFTAGRQNWKSDGTAAGTVQVDVPPTLVQVGNLFFYAGLDGKLFRTNGVQPGVELKSFVSLSNISNLTNVAGTLYFSAFDSKGRELWKSDGTVAGTVRVKDIPGGGLQPQELVNVGGQLYFTASDASGGRELWKSDGTANGTVRVKDIIPGPDGSSPTELTNVAGILYFSASDAASGRELWKSNGTAQGTTRVSNQGGGAVGSQPTNLTAFDGTLHFSAGTPFTGQEPFTLLPAPNVAPALNTTPNPTLGSIQEDTNNPGGIPVRPLVNGIQSDPDANALQGIAITGATQANGKWQFSLDNGATWRAVGNASETDARLLPARALVRFIPNPNFNGQAKLFYRAWDQTEGVAGELYTTAGHTGGKSAFSKAFESATLRIAPVNDPPRLILGGTLGYRQNTAAIKLAAAAVVTDVDKMNFGGGRLRVWITDGASTANRLEIGAGFTIDASNNVLLGTKIIGKRTSSGFGGADLIVAFTSEATPEIAQALVRTITFRTVSGAAGTRKILFTVSDGRGGISAQPGQEAIKIVNVT